MGALASVWVVLVSVSLGTGHAADEYDRLCDAIEQHARTAGMLYNRGQQDKAYASLETSRESFRAAIKLQPEEPQAYVSMATALLNAQQLEEALPLWQGAIERVSDRSVLRWLEGRERWTRYGLVSKRRDKIYAEGQGNVTAALELMLEQLAIYPGSPVLKHDAATAHVMVSQLRGLPAAEAALTGFTESQELSLKAWQAGLSAWQRAGPGCAERGGLVYDWLAAAANAKERPPTKAQSGLEALTGDAEGYVAKFKDVGMAGADGIIVDEQNCQIFLASAGPFISLPNNLQMMEIWGDVPSPNPRGPKFAWYDSSRGRVPRHGLVEKPETVRLAASVVQFSGTSHFHAITEVAGRLLLLQKHGILQKPGLQLVGESDTKKKKGFLTALYRSLAPELLEQDRIWWWDRTGPTALPDVRLRVSELYYADWRPPLDFREDGGHCATPGHLLRELREVLVPDLVGDTEKVKKLVFAVRRPKKRSVAMRSKLLNEEQLQTLLEEIARDAGLSFEIFDGKLGPQATAKLFHSARAVVGVHGGALANVLFCSEGSQLFELGFSTPLSGHYRHMASALGLGVTLLPLRPDDRGLGAAEVALEDLDAAVSEIRRRLILPAAREDL